MSASAVPGEQVLGTILHAALSPDYAIQAVVFTDRRVLGVSTAQLSRDASAAGLAGGLGAALLGAAGGTGVSGLLGMRAWGKYKQAVAGRASVRMERAPVPPEILVAVGQEIPYEKVKAVSVKKVWGSSDTLLDVSAGFLGTGKWFVPLTPEQVSAVIAQTPLAARLRA